LPCTLHGGKSKVEEGKEGEREKEVSKVVAKLGVREGRLRTWDSGNSVGPSLLESGFASSPLRKVPPSKNRFLRVEEESGKGAGSAVSL
jgi:hypothetical protein